MQKLESEHSKLENSLNELNREIQQAERNIKTLTLDIHSQLVYWIDTDTNYLKSIT